MNALTDVLRALRLTGAVFLDAESTAPWCIRAQVEPGDCAGFTPVPSRLIAYHYVLEGHLSLDVAGAAPVQAGPGQLLVLPHNDVHLPGSDQACAPADVAALMEPGGDDGLARPRAGGERLRILDLRRYPTGAWRHGLHRPRDARPWRSCPTRRSRHEDRCHHPQPLGCHGRTRCAGAGG